MELVTPDLGLALWTSVAFIILLVLLRAFAWGPILKAVNDREKSIQSALEAAEEAKNEMQALKASNDELLKQANIERDQIRKQARELQEKILSDAKNKAKEEADKIITNARESIMMEKQAAITELKNQVATLSIDIAEKIVREQLSSSDKQKTLADNLAAEVSLN